MKFVISTLPRSGSKVFQSNLHRYLESIDHCSALFYDVSVSSDTGLGEFFNHENSYDFCNKKAVLLRGEKVIISDDDVESIEEEVEKRLQIFKKINQTVVKCLWSTETQHTLIKNVSEAADKKFVLYRDPVEHILSAAVTFHTNILHACPEQQEVISLHRTHRLAVNKDYVVHCVSRYNEFRRHMPYGNAQWIKFEDLIAAKDSEEFCSILGLPHSPFTLFTDSKEYAENKRDMIHNVSEIEELIERHLDPEFK